MAKVAFLGLGVMGYPMAGHLKNKGGHEVTVYNRTFAKAEQWAKEFGGKAAKTPEEAAQRGEAPVQQQLQVAELAGSQVPRRPVLGSSLQLGGAIFGREEVDERAAVG